MNRKKTAQEKADQVAATFNRILRKTHDAPLTVEKVAMLHLVQNLLAKIEAGAGDGIILERLDDVKRDIGGIEDACRLAGLYEAFADLPRAERRRITKAIGDAQ